MKKILQLALCIVFLCSTSKVYAQQEISEYLVEAYEADGWVYFGDNTFLHKEKEKGYGNPKVLSLNIVPSTSTAMLYLFEYDCSNNRIMMIAYKKYENKSIMEKKHYLFESKKEWIYPLKTSIGDIMMSAVCEKYGN